MILSITATYALRAAAHLAAVEGDGATLGHDLAGAVDVPAQYLAKILRVLARVGVLTATRGARGGYRLARPADAIPLRAVVEPFEGERARPGCLLRPERPCDDERACPAHAAWSHVKTAYQEFLEQTTLADIRRGVLDDIAPRAARTRRRRAVATTRRKRTR